MLVNHKEIHCMNTSIHSHSSARRILIMTAVEAEREAVLQGLSARGEDRFSVQLAGVGPASAAARTTSILAKESFDMVISAGIGGGFAGYADIGSIVLASQMIAADLGSETPDHGFLSVDELGFGSSRIQADTVYNGSLSSAIQLAGLAVHIGPVLTVSTTTGSAESTAMLAERIPGASAEGMEGYGVALAAHYFHLPVLEIRAISNRVGPRDRSSWRIPDALQALTKASSILPEVL